MKIISSKVKSLIDTLNDFYWCGNDKISVIAILDLAYSLNLKLDLDRITNEKIIIILDEKNNPILEYTIPII